MRHGFLLLSLLLLTTACPPSRGGGGSDEPSTQSSSSAAWLVARSEVDSEISTSHSFIKSNRSGVCSAIRDYYEGYASGYVSYYEESAALTDDYADTPGYEGDPEYRRRYCELLVDWYDSFYAGSLFDAGSEVTTITLQQPDATEDGAPAEGTYALEGEGSEDEEAWTFSARRDHYLLSYYDEVLGQVDCDAYAADPDADLFGDAPPTDLTESWTTTAGSLELTSSSSDAWQLTLTDGREQSESSEDVQDATLDASFARCEVEYSFTSADP